MRATVSFVAGDGNLTISPMSSTFLVEVGVFWKEIRIVLC